MMAIVGLHHLYAVDVVDLEDWLEEHKAKSSEKRQCIQELHEAKLAKIRAVTGGPNEEAMRHLAQFRRCALALSRWYNLPTTRRGLKLLGVTVVKGVHCICGQRHKIFRHLLAWQI